MVDPINSELERQINQEVGNASGMIAEMASLSPAQRDF
jgi:hypothetical protein